MNPRLRLILLFLAVPLLLRAPANVHAQASPDIPAVAFRGESGSNFRFERLPSELGLSQNLISAILPDRKGFLWIGTKDGLNRFDGYKFTVYRHSPFDSTSLSDSYITALLEDRAGRIWVGTFSGGLNLFDRGRETFHRSLPDSANPNSLSHERIHAIAEDQQGAIWIGTIGGGLNKLVLPGAAKSFAGAVYTRFVHEPDNPNSLGDNFVLKLAVDQKNVLWAATSRAIYQIMPADSQRHSMVRFGSALPDTAWKKWWARDQNEPAYTMARDAQGKIWIGNELGLMSWNPAAAGNAYTFYEPMAELPWIPAAELWEDRTGALWCGSVYGLWRFDLQARTHQHFRHDPDDPQSISESGIKSICEDKGGVLWFGSNGNGLFKYDPKAAPFGRPANASGRISLWRGTSIRALCETRDGMILLAPSRGGLLQLNRLTGAVSNFSPDWQSFAVPNYFFSLLQDRQGALWLGSGRGLYQLAEHAGNFHAVAYYQPESGGSSAANTLYKILESRNGGNAGDIWIATNTLIARIDQRSGVLIKYRFSMEDPHVIEGNAFPSLYEDRRGIFWLCSGDGLRRFDPATCRFQHYRNLPHDPSSLSHNVVRAVHEDPLAPDKILWVATAGGGLNRFDRETETFTHFNENDGLPDNVIYAILSDQAGNLWMSTNKGLAKLDPRTLTFMNFSSNAGLQDNEFNSGAYFKSASGELFFGGIGGFNAFYPENIEGNPHAPPVAITGFQIFNKPVSFTAPGSPLKRSITETEELTLRYEQKVFSFEFAALDYTDPSKNQYAYKMENFDDDWRAAGASRTATYTNLNPGKYVFRVKGSNNDGVWNDQGASIRITITPPWWRTWWAYAFYVLFMLGAIAATIKGRVRYLERRTRELEATVAQRTTEVTARNQQLAEQREKLIEQAQKLEDLDHLKSNFFANISHEFRTPLTLILGPAEQEAAEAPEGRLKRNLLLIKNNAHRLLRLINQLLDLARLESGKMQLLAAPHDLVEFLKGLTMSFASLAERKRIALRFHSQAEKLLVYFDQDKLEKIFYNLLSNAFKFTPEGGEISVQLSVISDQLPVISNQSPVISTQVSDVSKQLRRKQRNTDHWSLNTDNWLLITVKDTGIGIPAERLPHIFDRFYQVDSSSTREYEGSGIGLALVKELVELHRGRISVTSTVGKGSIFTVHLPLGKAHLRPEEIIATAVKATRVEADIDFADFETEPPATSDRQPTIQQFIDPIISPSGDETIILVVEDHADFRHFIRSHLEPAYKVLEAANGAEGWETAVTIIPDLIISDVMMPKMNGYELCAKLKADERTSHIPVILLTAKAGSEDKVAGLQIGADDYLSKPFDAKELHARIRNLIESRRALRERFKHAVVLKPSDLAINSADEVFLKKVLAVVEKHLAEEELEVETLADEAAMSRAQLNRKLRALTGKSVMEFVQSIRLQRAAELLQKKAGTIAEIAFMVGFGDPSYFTKSFRKQFGKTPSEFVG